MKFNKNIAFLPDLSPSIGLGHFERCKTLSMEFAKKNYNCFFFFPLTQKKLLKKHKNFLKIKYFDKYNLKNIFQKILKYEIKIVIFDTYKKINNIENFLNKNNIYVVSIDDHFYKHSSNIIISNKKDLNNKYIEKKDQIYCFGPEYTLVKGKKIINNIKSKKLNILLHSGGSSIYQNCEIFTESTISKINNYGFNLDILCTNKKSKIYINNILKKNKTSSNINIIPFDYNLSNNLSKYNIVCGPAGTTTFESILKGCLTFSFQLFNDGRDDINSWYYLGNLMHLKYSEKNNKKIVNDCWDLIFNKFHKLKNILEKNSKVIDGYGPKRVSDIILKYYNKKKINIKKLDSKINFYKINKCKIQNIRPFLEARNRKVNRNYSTKNNHTIIWPEHINWWLKNNIYKYYMSYGSKIVGYHWLRVNKDLDDKFITSGWFLTNNFKENLIIVDKLLNHQISIYNKSFVNYKWIIITKNENKFVKYLNEKKGFIKASTLGIKRAINIFEINKKDYIIMEKK